MTLKELQVLDLQEIEIECGSPSYTSLGNSFPIKASISEISSTAVEGGFRVDKLLTGTARLYNAIRNSDGSVTLTPLYSTITKPKPKQIISFQGENYRVISVKYSSIGAYFRIIANGITRGF